jgi:hypothetical protein
MPRRNCSLHLPLSFMNPGVTSESDTHSTRAGATELTLSLSSLEKSRSFAYIGYPLPPSHGHLDMFAPFSLLAREEAKSQKNRGEESTCTPPSVATSCSLWLAQSLDYSISAVGTSSVLQSKAQGSSVRRSGGKVH